MPPNASLHTVGVLGISSDDGGDFRKWVRIGDFEYDVTHFKHPGGNIINYMLTSVGADATETFKEFHMRSKRAPLVLKSLPKRAAGPRRLRKQERQTLQAFDQFRMGLVKEGFFEPSMAHIFFRVLELVAMFCFGLYLFSLEGIAFKTAGVAVLGLFSGRCGWLQHEGGHNSLTCNMKVDKAIQAISIGFGLGTSASMWNSMHQKHHATPQKVGHDLDLDTTPLAAFFDTAIENNRKRAYSKTWIRFQAFTFLPFTSGCFVMLFWLLYLHPRKVIVEGKWHQGFWMLVSHTVRPMLMAHFSGVTFLQAYAAHWVCLWLAGMYLFGHFSLSHTHMPVVGQSDHANWVEYALNHTVDINPENPLVNWVMGYLNCQVVHHLFPNMPQFRQPEVCRRLNRFCKENSLEYNVISYPEAWRRTFVNLNEVGKHYFALKR